MSNLAHRQSKIQEKRKQTPRRQFVMEICSRKPLMFYKNQGMISIYPETNKSPRLVNFKKYSDSIDVFHIDYNKDLFGNISQLLGDVGVPNVAQMGSENSDFSDTNINSRSIYLSNVVINNCENVLYSLSIKDNSSNVLDTVMARNNSQNIYSCKAIINSFNIFYSKDISGGNNIWFSSNLQGCSECIYCNDLQNQSYCIENKKYEKSEYMLLKQGILSKKNYKITENKSLNLSCDDVMGTSNIECTNGENIYLSYNVKKGRNLILHGSTQGSEHAYDCFTGGSPYASHVYGVMGAGACEHIYCSVFVNGGSSNIYYSINLESCSFCLGCIGLKNKSYCILNKQYTKEEWYQKVDEIFTQMEADGSLGQFFPPSMNPFYFNDTAAYLIDSSFTREEVVAKGYLWRDEPIRVDIPADAQIVKTNELDIYEGYDDAGNRTINPDILKKVIQDDQGNVYRIIKMEYDFLVKHGLPLPRKHRLDRMKDNFKIN